MKFFILLFITFICCSLCGFFTPTKQKEIVAHSFTFLKKASDLENAYYAASTLHSMGKGDQITTICDHLNAFTGSEISVLADTFFYRGLVHLGNCDSSVAKPFDQSMLSSTLSSGTASSIEDLSYAVMIHELENISYDVPGTISLFEGYMESDSGLFFSRPSTGTATIENTLLAMDALMDIKSSLKEEDGEAAGESLQRIVDQVRFQKKIQRTFLIGCF